MTEDMRRLVVCFVVVSKNRRVELVVKKTDGPTGAQLGCDDPAAHGVKPRP